MSADLTSWALPRIARILPLDDESLEQIVTYSASLSKEAAAEHLKNLLGDSPAALEFITSFNSRRQAKTPSPRQSGTTTPRAEESPSRSNDSKNPAKANKRKKAPLHSTGPPRRPENYGNVTGAYKKADQLDDYMSGGTKSKRDATSNVGPRPSLSNIPSLSVDPDALQIPQTTTAAFSSQENSSASSRNPSPNRKTAKPPPSAAGSLISDYLPNVKSKAAKSPRHAASGASTPSKTAFTTTNIADLTAAIAALEVSTNPTQSKSRQTCTCNASLHPLFTPAPNCLNCGKIICSLEGLQPCSFCGAPLLTSEEIQSMIKELRAERGQEKMRAHNESVQHAGGAGPGSAPPSRASSASPSKLDAAVAHRDKLLNFQAQNARRTRVVDEAADFETPNVGSTQWMSPAQRALALKKQQQIQREMEEKARPEWEKKTMVMSLDIKSGRVVRSYERAPTPDPSAASSSETPNDGADHDLHRAAAEEATTRSRAAFSSNPLLASGGLVRPIWTSPDTDGEKKSKDTVDGKTDRRRVARQTWRRVQDDNDDNEQWILDGGLRGYEAQAT